MSLLTARYLLPSPGRWIEGGGLLVHRDRIVRILEGPGAIARARTAERSRGADLGDVVLTPGLVNAHAHLELGEFRGRLPGKHGFGAWVAAIVEERRRVGDAGYRRGLAAGARRLLATGTTAVGDIDATDAHDAVDVAPLLVRRFREVLDAHDPARCASALRRVSRRLAPTRTRREGLSPHAPFTTSPELLRRAAALVAGRRIPVQVHWSESREEVEWLVEGSGPFAAFLPPSPRRPGLDLLAEAGLLGRGTSLVHANHPARGEPARIAAAGAVVVHCPGTHAFFGRDPFPLERYRRAGVPVALGTDSLASNSDLDLRREMRLARAVHPALDPEAVWTMGTVTAARVLDFPSRPGQCVEGGMADLAAFSDLGNVDRRTALEALTQGEGRVAGVWIGGRRIALEPSRPTGGDHSCET